MNFSACIVPGNAQHNKLAIGRHAGNHVLLNRGLRDLQHRGFPCWRRSHPNLIARFDAHFIDNMQLRLFLFSLLFDLSQRLLNKLTTLPRGLCSRA
jgi:hypothetical protein